MSSISIKGIIVGALVIFALSFVLGFILIVAAVTSYEVSGGDDGNGALGPLLYYATVGVPPLVAGYVAATIAGKRELINGTLTGLSYAIGGFLLTLLLQGPEVVWDESELASLPLLSFLGGGLRRAIGWPAPTKLAAIGSRWNGKLKIAAQILLAIAGGFFLMTSLELAFFAPAGAWPAFTVLSFALMGCMKWFYRFRDAPLFAVGALFGLVLQGSALFLEPAKLMTPSLYRLLGACAGATLLGYFARRRFLLALVIAIPALVDARCLLCVPTFDGMNLEYLGWALARALPLPVAAFVGAALAHLAHRFRRR